MINAIAFDLDGTLYDESTYAKQAYYEIAKKMDLNRHAEIFEYLCDCRRSQGDSNVLQNAIDRFGIEREILPELIAIYRCCNAELTLFEDAFSFLKDTKLCKYYLLSNGGVSTQTNKIEKLNIKDYFDSIVITGEYLKKESWKPQKEAFELLNRLCDVDLDNCLYIGDSIEKDIKGAINAGMKACLINRGSNKPIDFNGEYWTINSMNEVNRIFEYENN